MAIRTGANGVEVLMIERVARGYFGGLWVFPGGGVEPIDSTDLARRAVAVPAGADDLAFRSAALRETIEEVGLAITDPRQTRPFNAVGAGIFEEALRQEAVLDGTRLHLISRWVTPERAPTRFDTYFYLVVAETDIALRRQPEEVIDVEWVEPAEALARAEAGDWRIVTPTRHHLEWLARHGEVGAIESASRRATVAPVQPRVESDGSIVRIALPEAANLP